MSRNSGSRRNIFKNLNAIFIAMWFCGRMCLYEACRRYIYIILRRLSVLLRWSSQFSNLNLCGRVGGVWSRFCCGDWMTFSVQFTSSGVYTLFVLASPCKSSFFDFRACVMSTMVLVYLFWVSEPPRFLLSFVARKEFLGSHVKSHRRYLYGKTKCLLVGFDGRVRRCSAGK